MSKVHEPELTGRVYFAIEHRRNLWRRSVFAPAQRIARRHRMGQTKVEILKQLRRGGSIVIEFYKHQGMRRVVHRDAIFADITPRPCASTSRTPAAQ
jgi:hypothetical protein